MAKYRKISPCIWNDEKVRGMTDRGKLALLFLLTHPHMTPLGAIRANAPGLACELGWTAEAFAEAFGEALAKGIAKQDEKASLIWFPKFLKHNPPESPNVVKSWLGSYDDLPECPLKGSILFSISEYITSLPKGFQKAFAEAFGEALPKGMPNQEQEQDIKKEDSLRSSSFSPEPDKPASGDTPPPPEAPPVISLPLSSGAEHPVSQTDVDEWVALYPAVDVVQQLRNMRGWLLSNPTKRKTQKGIRRFITGWLAKEQDRGGSVRASPGPQPGFRAGVSRQGAVDTTGQARQYHGDDNISWARHGSDR